MTESKDIDTEELFKNWMAACEEANDHCYFPECDEFCDGCGEPVEHCCCDGEEYPNES